MMASTALQSDWLDAPKIDRVMQRNICPASASSPEKSMGTSGRDDTIARPHLRT